MQGCKPFQRVGARAEQGRRPVTGVIPGRSKSRPFAALRRPYDADAQHVSDASPGSAGAVGQEAVNPARQRHERARHARRHGGYAAAVDVADAIRPPWTPDRVIQQHPVLHRSHPDLAGAAGGVQGHGNSQPWPRSNCAVSNSGSPTTPE